MAFISSLLPPILLAWFISSSMVIMPRPLNSHPESALVARLKLDQLPGQEGDREGGSTKCWDSLFQLQSCMGEVILFFLNGETYLGPGCCTAIRIIKHQCWPAMLGSLGFTSQEGDILRGYCDASLDSGSGAPPPPLAPGPKLNMSRDSIPWGKINMEK